MLRAASAFGLAASVLASAFAAAPAAAQDATSRPIVEDAPVRGFVYIEPFEIRIELVVRLAALADLETAVGRPADAGDLSLAEQAGVLARLQPSLAAACTLLADGEIVVLEPGELMFVTIDPAEGAARDARASIPVDDARIAAVFVAGRPRYPATVTATWSLFAAPSGPGPGPGAAAPAVPLVFEVTSRGEVADAAFTVTPAAPGAAWTLPDVGAVPEVLPVVALVPGRDRKPLAAAAALGGLGGLLLVAGVVRGAGPRRGTLLTGVLSLALGGGVLAGASATRPGLEDGEARAVVESVLRNVYGAFAYRDAETIYDTLATSVDGDLLEELFLDIREGLVVEGEGGPRVKVLEVSIVDCEARTGRDGRGLEARTVWVSRGTVSHMGHVHERRNQYRAELVLEPVDGVWRLTRLTILDETRT